MSVVHLLLTDQSVQRVYNTPHSPPSVWQRVMTRGCAKIGVGKIGEGGAEVKRQIFLCVKLEAQKSQ